MDPWKSWAVVLAGGGFAYYYYTQRSASSARKGRNLSAKEFKKQQDKQRREAGHSGSDTQYNSAGSTESSKKRKVSKSERKAEPSRLSNSVTLPEADADDDNNDGVDNKEFARQLTEAKQGTNLAKSTDASKQPRKKSKKTTKANEASSLLSTSDNQEISAASSTTGADADDDLSPAVSPPLNATNAPESGDVSDMLEAPSAGPAILRLTEPENGEWQKQQKPRQKTFEKAETKKQRQNRKKNEAKKLARDEDEKERRVLLEKQLRTAREAEGRPARNGLTPAKAPANSAWGTASTAPAVNGVNGTHKAAPAGIVPLLDTFDKEAEAPKATKSSAPAVKEAATNGSWERDLPSEEEQMRMLAESDDSAWSTVGKKGKKKATAATAPAVEADSTASSISISKESSKSGTSFEVLSGASDKLDDGKPFEANGNSDWAA